MVRLFNWELLNFGCRNVVWEFVLVTMFLICITGCDTDKYSEGDAYEDGYGGQLPTTEVHFDVWCEGFHNAIKKGHQNRSGWSSSGCGAWDDYQ